MAIQIQTILVPLDFSDHVPVLLEWAEHLAEEHDSRVVLLHAYHLPVEFQQLEGAYLPADFWANVKQEAEQQLGALAERAKAAGVATVVFDRGGYRYHGRVKALADSARAAGLVF